MRPCLYAHFKDYPAPYPVTKPEGDKSEVYSEPIVMSYATAATATAIPPVQASFDAPDDFNVFDFDDRIK